MATRGHDIGADWTEVTTPLMMADGTTYAMEMQSEVPGTVVESHAAQHGAPPAENADGEVWYPKSKTERPDPEGTERRYTKAAGWNLWLRSKTGPARVVVTEEP